MRLLFGHTICMVGRECAALFYDPSRFVRKGGAPRAMKKTLLGRTGVQTLDGEAHQKRKRMFMSLMTPDNIGEIADAVDSRWETSARRWEAKGSIELYRESREALFHGVCEWAAVPIHEKELEEHLSEVTALFDQAGDLVIGHIRSRIARRRTERWLINVVHEIRAGKLAVPDDSAAHRIAQYRDVDGKLLDERTAAVELLNIIRPTVAVAVFVVQAALALHDYPETLSRIRAEGEGYLEMFVEEVRRFYPFFPFIAARVKDDFEWKGYRFEKGTRVILDIYGTNLDPLYWRDPDRFDPERFRGRRQDNFSFIPQGGGDAFTGHRCAGEALAVELVKRAVHFLCHRISYDVPRQDLAIDFSSMPALPPSRMVLSNIRFERRVTHPYESQQIAV
jgi:fatty-acid peroxygenase